MVASKQNVHRDVVINNELGLHARSAAQIARIVQKSKANVWIKRGRETVDASSIMDILTLACEKGTTITVIIEDPSDIDVLDAVVELVNSGFGE
jgi:phosphocarrier protein